VGEVREKHYFGRNKRVILLIVARFLSRPSDEPESEDFRMVRSSGFR
jgi:hypothetical protein